MPITRRNLLGLLSSSTFFFSASPLGATVPRPGTPLTPAEFPQGVASGDPQPDSVVLWTRAVPRDSGPAAALRLQVAADREFTDTLLERELQADGDSDYTVRCHVAGLAPDRHYYYRFHGGDGTASRVGRTRTAPAPDQARDINVAFASCQSYEQAHYGGWARMLEEDRRAPPQERIHFVLFLGDFIYERCWHRRVDGSPQARKVPPFPDGYSGDEYRYAVSLADYRHLYHTYLSDPHLQAARARWPFVCTWDDHEFSNDNFQSYSSYGAAPRLDARRKLWSNQAWFEFIPAALDELPGQACRGYRDAALDGTADQQNVAARDSLCIYRRLNWGRNLDLVVTDSRSYRSPPPVDGELTRALDLPLNTVKLVSIMDAGRDYADGNPPATLPYAAGDIPNPARERAPGSMLGPEQREWFLDTLQQSSAAWKLWGNALPLVPVRLDMSSLPFAGYEDSVIGVDGWAGYPHELHLLLSAVQARGITGLVSLSGDHHMHGAGAISRDPDDAGAPPVAVDFTIAGIASSPLFGDVIAKARGEHPDFAALVYRETGAAPEPVWNMSMLWGVLAAFTYSRTGVRNLARWLGPNRANRGLAFLDTDTNGYGLATFRPESASVRIIGLAEADCREDADTPPAIRYVARFELPLWQRGETPQLNGPEFADSAPFPFEPTSV